MWAPELNWKVILTYYVTGFPFDCIQAAATWLFLWFAADPMLEKLEPHQGQVRAGGVGVDREERYDAK